MDELNRVPWRRQSFNSDDTWCHWGSQPQHFSLRYLWPFQWNPECSSVIQPFQNLTCRGNCMQVVPRSTSGPQESVYRGNPDPLIRVRYCWVREVTSTNSASSQHWVRQAENDSSRSPSLIYVCVHTSFLWLGNSRKARGNRRGSSCRLPTRLKWRTRFWTALMASSRIRRL